MCVASFAVTLFPINVVAAKPKPSAKARSAALAEAYARARDAESDAAQSIIQLDRDVRGSAVRNDFSQREAAAFKTDVAVNDALKAAYVAAIHDRRPDADRVLVRTALLHWTTLLRRRSMGSLHTVVPGLVEDVRCRGDIAADHLFERYFDTLFESPDAASSRHAIGVLAALARQSACLSERQSAKLASDLYWSFADLTAFLHDNGLERLKPAIVQAGAAPLLLFYDVEKDRGPSGPLTRWFIENRDDLIAGAVSERIPMAWQGLWLYDRRSGTLLGFKATRNAVNQNAVNLVAFFDSITRFTHLGDYACTFAEMVARGETRLGYLCGSSSCAKTNPQTTADVSSQLSGFVPAYGVSDATLNQTVCSDGGGGGTGGGGGAAGSSLCSDANIGGGGAMGGLFNCVSNLRMTSQQKMMRCFAEATGMCANPIDKANKQMQDTLYGGVPMGSGCQVSKGHQKPKQTERKPGRETGTEKCADCKSWKDPLNPLTELNTAERQMKVRSVKEALDRTNDAIKNLESLRKSGASGDDIKKAEGQVKAANDEFENLKEDLKKYDEEHDILNDVTGQCPPDVPECGGDQCTAMSAQTQAVLSCAEQQANGNQRPQNPNGGVFDPPEEGNESPELAHCLETLTTPQSRNHQCWAVTCANNRTTVVTENGDCGCGGAVPQGGLMTSRGLGDPLCGATLDCGENARQEGCKCAGTTTFGGLKPSAPHFDIPTPQSYSKVAGVAPH